jgi:hypothetical protein
MFLYTSSTLYRGGRYVGIGKPCEVGWAEELPPSCPPTTASNPNGQTFYRLVIDNPPVIDDFYSHVKRNLPVFPKTRPCDARSVSLISSLDVARNTKPLTRYKTGAIAHWYAAGQWRYQRKEEHVHWVFCGACDLIGTITAVE